MLFGEKSVYLQLPFCILLITMTLVGCRELDENQKEDNVPSTMASREQQRPNLVIAGDGDFGKHPSGTIVAPRTFTVTNNGTSDAAQMRGSIIGDDRLFFSFVGGKYPGSGGTCRSTLGFQPSRTGNTCTVVVEARVLGRGVRNATLVISYPLDPVTKVTQGEEVGIEQARPAQPGLAILPLKVEEGPSSGGNSAPVASNGSLTTNEDNAASGNLVASDPDHDPLTYSVVDNGRKGTSSITDASSGAFVYKPNKDANGSDTFTFKATDGKKDSNIATISVAITPVNDPPVASDLSFEVDQGGSFTGSLVASDVDGDVLSYSLVNQPGKGVVVVNPATASFTYTANADVSGDDSFTYQATDGNLLSNVAVVTIRIRTRVLTWTKQLGGGDGDRAVGTAVDGSGNVYLAGSTMGSFEGEPNKGSRDAFVAKLDSGGDMIWKKQVGGGSQDLASSIAVDGSGSVYLAGSTMGSFEGEPNEGSRDAFVAKFDSVGNLIWKKQLGGSSYDAAYSTAVDSSGSVYLVGNTDGSFEGGANKGQRDTFIAKLDSSGNVVWKRQLGGSSDDYAFDTTVDGVGNVYLAGYTNGSFEGTSKKGVSDAFVAKLDPSGNLVSKTLLGREATSYVCFSVAVDSSGNIYLAGDIIKFIVIPTVSETNAYVAKFDSSGNTIWEREVGGGGSTVDIANAVTVDSSANVYLAGYTDGSFEGEPSKGSQDAFIVKLDSFANIVWKKQLGGVSFDIATGVAVDGFGNNYLAGYTYGSFEGELNKGETDAFIMKLLP